jgi:Protein of unknown function (DUF2752)
VAAPVRSLRELGPPLFLIAFGALLVAGLPWRCPLFALTGLPCPSCGLTRALRLALQGNFAGATRMHPLWFLVWPACAVLAVGEMLSYRRYGRWGAAIDRRWVRWGLATLALALAVLWIARFGGAFGGPVGVAASAA